MLKLLFSGNEGHIFYQSLQPQICSHLALNQEEFIPVLMEEVCRAPEVVSRATVWRCVPHSVCGSWVAWHVRALTCIVHANVLYVCTV